MDNIHHGGNFEQQVVEKTSLFSAVKSKVVSVSEKVSSFLKKVGGGIFKIFTWSPVDTVKQSVEVLNASGEKLKSEIYDSPFMAVLGLIPFVGIGYITYRIVRKMRS